METVALRTVRLSAGVPVLGLPARDRRAAQLPRVADATCPDLVRRWSRPATQLRGCRRQLAAATFDVADEIADRTDLIGFIIGDFHAESILDRDHQFESVEPVGPEIFGEVRVVDHVLD